jgi:hypothetical protein
MAKKRSFPFEKGIGRIGNAWTETYLLTNTSLLRTLTPGEAAQS